MARDQRDMQIHYADEWAALYVGGQLVTVGDSSNTEEKAFRLLDVTIVRDDTFMRGQTKRDGVARYLSDIELYRQERNERTERAMRLRHEAYTLIAQAQELEKQC
jgi:hypothetical protein